MYFIPLRCWLQIMTNLNSLYIHHVKTLWRYCIHIQLFRLIIVFSIVYTQLSPAVLAAATLGLSTFSSNPLTRPVNSAFPCKSHLWFFMQKKTAAMEWVTMLGKRQTGPFSWKQMLPRLITKAIKDCMCIKCSTIQ